MLLCNIANNIYKSRYNTNIEFLNEIIRSSQSDTESIISSVVNSQPNDTIIGSPNIAISQAQGTPPNIIRTPQQSIQTNIFRTPSQGMRNQSQLIRTNSIKATPLNFQIKRIPSTHKNVSRTFTGQTQGVSVTSLFGELSQVTGGNKKTKKNKKIKNKNTRKKMNNKKVKKTRKQKHKRLHKTHKH